MKGNSGLYIRRTKPSLLYRIRIFRLCPSTLDGDWFRRSNTRKGTQNKVGTLRDYFAPILRDRYPLKVAPFSAALLCCARFPLLSPSFSPKIFQKLRKKEKDEQTPARAAREFGRRPWPMAVAFLIYAASDIFLSPSETMPQTKGTRAVTKSGKGENRKNGRSGS